MSGTKQRLVVLISGHGSNLQAILDACAAGQLQAQVVAVIANRSKAYGLCRAEQHGIPRHVLLNHGTRQDYDQNLARLVTSYAPDLIVLAGWLRLLSMSFLANVPCRVINIHPALPGQFAGLNAIERAFISYQRGEVKHTGVMVHFVPDEGVDSGPVIASETIPITVADSLESLSQRVHACEHRLLIAALRQLSSP